MELTNIAQTGGPTAVHAKMDTTLSNLGINVCHCLTASPTTNPTNMAPDSFHQFSVDNNMGTWWAMFTQEEYNSMVPEDGNILLSIPGATRMPRFDKVIVNTSPQAAAATLVYHMTEGHCTTGNPKGWILVAFQQDHQQGLLRLGNGCTNVFNRGYVAPQLQIEFTRVLRFNIYELSTQQVWKIGANNNQDVLESVHNRLSWQNNVIWSYNAPVNVANINSTEDNIWPHFIQALEYSGLQCLDHLSTEVANKVKQLLTTVHPLVSASPTVNTSTVHWHGSKTMERLRGSPNIIPWVTNIYDHSEYVTEVNTWRNNADEHMEDDAEADEDNMDS